MSIKVTKFINENTTLWDNFINCSNNGTLFHYRAFLNYHENVVFNDHSLLFYKNNKLICLLPGTSKENTYQSHPGISFGGFIYNEKMSYANAQNIVKAFIHYIKENNYNNIQLTIPPICYSRVPSDYIEFCLNQYGFKNQRLELSNVLSLSSTFEDTYKAYKPAARQANRKAEKSNITIVESGNFEQFYSILSKNLSLRHNTTPTHTLSELKKLKNLFPNQINLFTAELNNKIIAGVINFICNDNTVLAFYISHDMQYQNMRPLNILFTHIFKWAITNNYQYYDFGLCSDNGDPNLNLARFKESFGADGMFRKTMILEL